MSTAAEVKREIAELADPELAELQQRYFKTGPGEYGEGDVFVGVKVPPLRALSKKHRDLPLGEIDKLLASKFHEHRAVALMILTLQAARADLQRRKALCDYYLAHTERVNNWDLVDLSCREIVGGYLLATGEWDQLRRLARSDLLWDRRIAIISTAYFIREDDYTPTLTIAEMLLGDPHDLMHKAVGWMLREVGKRDMAVLEQFLDAHAAGMPRTALRYSVERMTPERRAYWRAR